MNRSKIRSPPAIYGNVSDVYQILILFKVILLYLTLYHIEET